MIALRSAYAIENLSSWTKQISLFPLLPTLLFISIQSEII